MRKSLTPQMPAALAAPVFSLIRSQFRKQLYAREIARHDPDIITRKGRADLNALSGFLGERPFLLTDRPTSADTAVFGLLAPTVYWSMETPVAMYARSLPNLKAYCDRMRERCFVRPK
jgi:glutathione S-transferase